MRTENILFCLGITALGAGTGLATGYGIGMSCAESGVSHAARLPWACAGMQSAVFGSLSACLGFFSATAIEERERRLNTINIQQGTPHVPLMSESYVSDSTAPARQVMG